MEGSEEKPVEDKSKNVPCPWKLCKKPSCKLPWHRPCSIAGSDLDRLRPLVLLVAVFQISMGCIFAPLVYVYADHYDRMFSCGNLKVEFLSMSTFAGLATLVLTGIWLLIAILLKRQRCLWKYIVVATLLSIYLLLLSTIKIHLGLSKIKEVPSSDIEAFRFQQGNACVSGVFTLLGAVVHFVGSIVVFTYYNLKYIQPVMYDLQL